MKSANLEISMHTVISIYSVIIWVGPVTVGIRLSLPVKGIALILGMT